MYSVVILSLSLHGWPFKASGNTIDSSEVSGPCYIVTSSICSGLVLEGLLILNWQILIQFFIQPAVMFPLL